MKTSGRCPKCQSSSVFKNIGSGLGEFDNSYNLQLLGKNWNSIDLVTYLCADCGYIELYADEQTDDPKKPKSRLDFIRECKEWQKE